MPWQELSPVNLRMRFVTEWETDCWSMTDLCAEYGVSRKTGYKWLERYEAGGPAGLHDQSRRTGGRRTVRRRRSRTSWTNS